MINDNKEIIERFRLRIILLLAIRYLLLFSMVAGFFLGLAILILRVVFLVSRADLFWSFLIFVPVFFFSILAALVRIPSVRSLKSLLDSQNKCGGLLVASDEVDLGIWQNKLSRIACPKVRWKNRKVSGLLTVSAIFVIAGFLVPQKYVQIVLAGPLKIDKDVEKLAEQIETLKEENIIPEKTADEFEQALEEVKKTASGSDPVKTWESLDHIQQNLKKQAQDAAGFALSQTENLTKAEALSQALAETGAELDSKISADAAAELSAMVKSLADENEKLRESLDPNIFKAFEQGQLNSEQLSQLMEALKSNKLNLSGSLSKLCKAGLIDVNSLKMCEALGQCDANGLGKCLCKDANSLSIGQMLSMCCGGNIPGRGGVDRGRADAPMTWTEGSDEENAKFKEKILPPSSLSALKESITVGVSISEPVVEDGSQSTATGNLGSAAPGGGQAVTRKILPRHKGAVKRYFEREQK